MTLDWFEAYGSLIFQIYGLAFFVMGIAALLSMRSDGGAGIGAHLGWLAAFGVLHGCQEFIDGVRLSKSDEWLVVLSHSLMSVSFLALMEFGRRTWNQQVANPRLAALPLYMMAFLLSVAVLLTASSASAGLELSARYLFGAPGALLAGMGLLAQARAVIDTAIYSHWLRVAAFAMLGYAALTVVVSPGSGRHLVPWLPTTADFFAVTGLPVQLARALCAVLLAVSFVFLSRRSASVTTITLQRVTNRLDGFVYRCRNDRNRSMTFMSGGGESLVGYPAREFLLGKRHFGDQVHPDDQQRVWEEIQAGLEAGGGYRLHYRVLDHEGSVRWCYEEGSGFFDTQGRLLYLEGLVRNDEVRHQVQQALQKERDFARELVDNAPVIVLLLSSSGLIQYVNPYFERLSGYRMSDIQGKEWFATCLPARDQAITRKLFSRAIHGQPVRGNINAIASRDGSEYAIEWHALSLRDANAQVTGLLSIGMDVTERQALEKQLHELTRSLEQRVADRTAEVDTVLRRNLAILDTAIDGFFAVDINGRIRQTNPAFCAMLGYEEPELLAMSIPDIEAVESEDDVSAHIDKVMAQGHDRFDTCHRCKDGTVLELEISVSLVVENDETMFYAFARDIGPRKAAEMALRQASDEAKRSNAAKDEFLSRMSHELRTPLNAILGFAQVLQLPDEQPLSTQQLDNVHQIHHAGEHLLTLVNEMLDLARLESGQLAFNVEPVALCPVIQHCVSQISPGARERGIFPTLQLHAPCTVVADPGRLEQVLLNLLSNAVKYNRDGGSITVECFVVEGQRARVGVHDTGGGLSVEQQQRLFRPFERFESAYEGIDGAGIGLALAKQLIEGMGGCIGVDSHPGEGSTFWFELPLCDAPEDAEQMIVALPTAGSVPSRVLCVEDNPANLLLVERILNKRADIELSTATNAEDGLVLAKRERPDLILLDINLPGMDGYQLMRVLKADPSLKTIPVIAITANAMPNDVDRGKAAGFVDYLTKPLNIPQFLEIIERLLTSTRGDP